MEPSVRGETRAHRHAQIVQYISERKEATLAELASHFGVSQMTVYRDVVAERLEADGIPDSTPASGKRAEAQKILAELNEMSKQAYVSPYDKAILYVGLGDKDRAIEELNRAYDDRAGWMIYLNVEPMFDPLRSDPRLAELIKKVGLP